MPSGFSPKKEKYFWSYLSAMSDLQISRRTLQRWIDDLDIKSLEFEDHLRVFLTLPHIESLREYGQFMRTRNQPLIKRYRAALDAGNNRRLSRLRKELAEFQLESQTSGVSDTTILEEFDAPGDYV